VAQPRDIGLVAAAAAGDDALRERIARAAYDLCRDLGMGGPAAALVAVARDLSERPAPPRPEPVAHRTNGWTDGVAPMALWLPAVDGGGAAPGVTAAPLDRSRSSAPVGDRCAVLVTELSGDGPAAATSRSLAAHVPALQVQVATSGPGVGRGEARNALLAGTDAAFVVVLDGGDELLDDTLEEMVGLLRADDELDAVLCPATHGTQALVNLLVPEERRLRERDYLTRGYVVRRTTLEALGGFTEDPDHLTSVDHHFWLSLAAGGGRTGMIRRIGLALWPH
jgi:cellulose synthase/poly-beta-1,6-N-acetylglucosamine synthase-like glycosyltransferase